MTTNTNLIDQYFAGRKSTIASAVCDLIAIDTSSPRDNDAFPYLLDYLRRHRITATLEKISASVKHHDLRSHHLLSGAEKGYTLRAKIPAESGGEDVKGLLLQSHIDVVPAGPEYPEGFSPRVEDGIIYGRGACDAKGNVIMGMEAVIAMMNLGLRPAYDIFIDIVIEEEIGGNGALGSILSGCPGDQVIILEPTEFQPFVGNRGCVTFEVEMAGKSVHAGSKEQGVSAIEKTIVLIEHLKNLERELLEEARRDPLFGSWERPLQLNVGLIEGGEWPGSIPQRCVLTANLGFLPNYSITQIQERLERHLSEISDQWILDGHYDLHYNGIRNGAYVMDPDDELPRSLYQISKAYGNDIRRPYGWNVSCDARFYHNLLGLPTVIFGAGSLSDAHSNREKIALDDIIKGCKILMEYMSRPGPQSISSCL